MDKKRIFMLGIVLLIGLMLAGCAWHYGGYPAPYYNLGFAYYGYPSYQGDEGGNNILQLTNIVINTTTKTKRGMLI